MKYHLVIILDSFQDYAGVRGVRQTSNPTAVAVEARHKSQQLRSQRGGVLHVSPHPSRLDLLACLLKFLFGLGEVQTHIYIFLGLLILKALAKLNNLPLR